VRVKKVLPIVHVNDRKTACVPLDGVTRRQPDIDGARVDELGGERWVMVQGPKRTHGRRFHSRHHTSAGQAAGLPYTDLRTKDSWPDQGVSSLHGEPGKG